MSSRPKLWNTGMRPKTTTTATSGALRRKASGTASAVSSASAIAIRPVSSSDAKTTSAAPSARSTTASSASARPAGSARMRPIRERSGVTEPNLTRARDADVLLPGDPGSSSRMRPGRPGAPSGLSPRPTTRGRRAGTVTEHEDLDGHHHRRRRPRRRARHPHRPRRGGPLGPDPLRRRRSRQPAPDGRLARSRDRPPRRPPRRLRRRGPRGRARAPRARGHRPDRPRRRLRPVRRGRGQRGSRLDPRPSRQGLDRPPHGRGDQRPALRRRPQPRRLAPRARGGLRSLTPRKDPMLTQIATAASAATAHAVAATAVTRRYGEGESAVDALRGVTLEVPVGQFTAVMGPSGSGKSTLMPLLAGLDRPTEGTVVLAGTDLTTLNDDALTQLRRDRVGFIFQAFNLLPVLDARENIVLPMSIAGRDPDDAWVDQLIDLVGLRDRITHRPSELSGGKQQRVAVVRALASRPAVVFADEPTGNLDTTASTEILQLLRRSVDEFGQTIIMVTHDEDAAAYADRLLVLRDGRLVEDRAPARAPQAASV